MFICSNAEESVIAGRASNGAVTVNVKVAAEDPPLLVAVIVYVVADFAIVTCPESRPVLVLKVVPAGALGLIA